MLNETIKHLLLSESEEDFKLGINILDRTTGLTDEDFNELNKGDQYIFIYTMSLPAWGEESSEEMPSSLVRLNTKKWTKAVITDNERKLDNEREH